MDCTPPQLFYKKNANMIKTPCTLCSTINCPKASECLRKATNLQGVTYSTYYTPHVNLPNIFACKGFLPIPTNKK